jgi:formyltetrahydrofolate-dependent phosphoribosylglycinamide formyltransferase
MESESMLKLVVLISGSGTNLQAIMDAIAKGHLKAEIAAVIANRKNAYGLVRAAEAGIDTLYLPLKPYTDEGKSRAEYDADLAAKVKEYNPNLIVLAGWMHILSSAFLDEFPRMVINLHPALPGEFTGVNAIERAYEAAQKGEIKRSGVMIHYAIPEVDAGDVIMLGEVPILETDSLADFAARMHATEHQMLVQAIAMLAERMP